MQGDRTVRYARGVNEVDGDPWAEPAELVALRARVREAQERVDRATRQLELAAEHEARRAAEFKATEILLKAELRAAQILNGAGSPDGPGSYNPAGIDLEAARVLEEHLARLASIEAAVVAIARQFVRDELAVVPGSSRLSPDDSPARQRARPVGQSVPVPLFRRPGRGGPA